MTTTYKDASIFAGGLSASSLGFASVSFMGAASAIGTAISTPFGWSITNLGANAEDRAISGTDTTAANTAAALATLVRELGKKGILTVTG